MNWARPGEIWISPEVVLERDAELGEQLQAEARGGGPVGVDELDQLGEEPPGVGGCRGRPGAR